MTNEDQIRQAFLRDLDDADHINLTDWETDFVGSNAFPKYDGYSDKQREWIDKLKRKYESRL